VRECKIKSNTKIAKCVLQVSWNYGMINNITNIDHAIFHNKIINGKVIHVIVINIVLEVKKLGDINKLTNKDIDKQMTEQ
jgi:hypothetical protein